MQRSPSLDGRRAQRSQKYYREVEETTTALQMDEYCAVDKFDIRNYSINNDQNELSPRMGNYDGKYYFSRDKCEPGKHNGIRFRGTIKEKRKEIEKNNIHFWKWLNNISTDKTWYYMVRQSKVKLKSTVKMKQWYRSEIFEENSFIEESEGNKTFKYFIGSTCRISADEELGGCWIFRSRKNFYPWKIGQCKEQGIVQRIKRSNKNKNIIHAEKI